MSLLEDGSALERELMAQVAGADNAAKLQPIVWGEVGSRVYVPQWTQLVQLNAAGLKGITPESLSQLATDLKSFGKTLHDRSGATPSDEQAATLANVVVGAALNLLLIRCGGQLDITPGNDFSVKLGGRDVQPFGILPALQNGKMTGDAWAVCCVELGIAGAELGAVVSPSRDGADEKCVC